MLINNDVFTQVFARSDKKRDVYIPEKSRYLNTIAIGTKNTGKTYELLPIMARQDIENKECGATFVVGKKDMAFFLYSLARKHGRKVILIKPSTSIEADELLWQNDYDYDYINENVINYKEAIKKKYIVIIDMEYTKYKAQSIKATGKLLLQLQLDMQETFDTLKRPHFVYIDDAHYYFSFIEVLLTAGDHCNVGTTLFVQSRNQFKQKDRNYSSLIDNNIRSIILMNGLNMTDVEYYMKQFYEHNINVFMNRKNGQVIYETLDNTNTRRNGCAELMAIDEELKIEMEEKSLALRKKLTKKKRKMEQIDQTIEEDNDIEEVREDKIKGTFNDVEFIIPNAPTTEANKSISNKPEIKTEIKKEVKVSSASTKVEKPTPKVQKQVMKKAPKEIVAENFNKLNKNYEVCDGKFDFDEEF